MSSGPSVPPRSRTHSQTVRADLAAVEGLGALGREALERVGRRPGSERGRPRGAAALGRVESGDLGGRGQDRVEDLEEVGLLARSPRRRRGRARIRRLDQPRQRHRPVALEHATRRRPGFPGTPQEAAPTLKICGVLVEVDGDRHQLGAALDAVGAAGGDEEVDQDVGGARRRWTSMKPAGAEAGQRALGDERGEHRADARRRPRCRPRAAPPPRPPRSPDARLRPLRVRRSRGQRRPRARSRAERRRLASVAGDELGHVEDEPAVRRRRARRSAVLAAAASRRASRAVAVRAPVADRVGVAAGRGRVRRGRGSGRARARGSRGVAVAVAPVAVGEGVSKRVAITVIQTSSDMSSSMLAPKMMLASGCAASWTISAASLASISERSGPPVIESSSECAPSTECRAAARRPPSRRRAWRGARRRPCRCRGSRRPARSSSCGRRRSRG